MAVDEQFSQRRFAGTWLPVAEEAERLAAAVRGKSYVHLGQALLERGVDDACGPQSFGRRRDRNGRQSGR